MLEDRPVLKDRLYAVATFGGIALATAMAFDFMVTGGFDFGARRTQSTYTDPFAFASAATSSGISAWAPEANAHEVSWTAPMPLDDVTTEDTPPLDGDSTSSAVATQYAAPSEDELYREITALYEAQDATQDEMDSRAYTEDEADVEPPPEKPDVAASAYESESLW